MKLIDNYKEEIEVAPHKCNTSDGNWGVLIIRKYDSGMKVTYSEHFFRKKDAKKFIQKRR